MSNVEQKLETTWKWIGYVSKTILCVLGVICVIILGKTVLIMGEKEQIEKKVFEENLRQDAELERERTKARIELQKEMTRTMREANKVIK